MGVQVAKKRKKRRSFSPEYKSEVVELVRTSGRSVGDVSREMGLTETAVRTWVKKAEADGVVKQAAQDEDVHAELRAARKRIKELEMEKAILKKFAALYVKEGA